MKYSKIIICVIAVIIIVTAGVVVGANLDKSHSSMENMGKYDLINDSNSQISDVSDKEITYSGKNVDITQAEIDRVVQRTRAGGNMDLTEDEIVAIIARNESLYYQAINAGTEISSEELMAAAAQDRQAIEATDNYSEFEMYLEGLEMTADEYWESRVEDRIYKRDALINKYLQELQSTMLMSGKISSLDEWPEMLEKISEEAVHDEAIKSNKSGEQLEIEYEGVNPIIKNKTR